jgi:hypothetical protein
MGADLNKNDSCCSIPTIGVYDTPIRNRSPWRVICSIPLFIYGIIPLIAGAWGLIFVPAIIFGGVTIGEHTTLLKIIGWIIFHLVICAHGCGIIIAAKRILRGLWRRGIYIIAFSVILPGILIIAVYIIAIAFGTQ